MWFTVKYLPSIGNCVCSMYEIITAKVDRNDCKFQTECSPGAVVVHMFQIVSRKTMTKCGATKNSVGTVSCVLDSLVCYVGRANQNFVELVYTVKWLRNYIIWLLSTILLCKHVDVSNNDSSIVEKMSCLSY